MSSSSVFAKSLKISMRQLWFITPLFTNNPLILIDLLVANNRLSIPLFFNSIVNKCGIKSLPNIVQAVQYVSIKSQLTAIGSSDVS